MRHTRNQQTQLSRKRRPHELLHNWRRFVLDGADSRQILALEQSEAGPAAGGDVGHLVGEAGLLHGGNLRQAEVGPDFPVVEVSGDICGKKRANLLFGGWVGAEVEMIKPRGAATRRRFKRRLYSVLARPLARVHLHIELCLQFVYVALYVFRPLSRCLETR